jgi:hypothetical protein
MAEAQPHQPRSFTVRRDQPLIGIPDSEDGQEVTRYFVDEEAADAASSGRSIERALSLAGAWEAIDSDDALEELDRIRHQSKPTPPFEL